MKKFTLFFLFCLSVCLCFFSSSAKDKPQKGKSKTKIVNGSNITVSLAPHQVLIKGTDNGGGSIIAKRWILTAAHLNIGSNTEFYAGVDSRGNLGAGQSKTMEGDPKDLPGAGGGGDNYINDLCLVKVNSDFNFNGNVEMIKLASSTNSTLWTPKNGSIPGARPYVSGFGNTESGGSLSNSLKRTQVEVTSIDDNNNKINAGGNYGGINYDACQGLIQVNANGVCGSNQKNLFITVNNCGYRLYPNPAQNVVNLEFENPEQPESIPIAVEIYDEKKQKKLKSFDWSKAKSKKKEIDVSDLPRGIHYVKLYFDKKKEVETVRLILE